jgi:hypothetical protein
MSNEMTKEPQWEEVRKARPPDEERFQTPPGVPAEAGRHDDERANFEAQLYVFLIDAGWTPVNDSDCTMHDLWTHPTSLHSGKTGFELAAALGFDHESLFRQLLRRFK